MMQMNMKRATVIFIIFMTCIGLAYAGYSIYGNTVSETVSEYTFAGSFAKDSSEPIFNTTLTLSGRLYYASIGASGKTVYLERSPDSTTWVTIQSTVTNGNGNFSFSVNRIDLGTFHYRPRFDIP